MKRRFRIRSILLLVLAVSIALAWVRDRSVRRQRDFWVHAESYCNRSADGVRARIEFCRQQKPSTPYKINLSILYIIDGKRRPYLSWQDEAEQQEKVLSTDLRSADEARKQKEFHQHRLIFPF